MYEFGPATGYLSQDPLLDACGPTGVGSVRVWHGFNPHDTFSKEGSLLDFRLAVSI